MVEIQKWKQVYMTTNVPADDGGNYYYPALVPANAIMQLPVTDIAPDPALGDRGLKFDWATNTWDTSEDDPTNNKIAELQQVIKGLTANQLNMIADQTNASSQAPTPASSSSTPVSSASSSSAPASSASSSSASSTPASASSSSVQGSLASAGSQSGTPSLSAMAGMLNNSDMAKKGDS